MLLSAALPAFVAETKFSGDAFRLFRWRTPETREQIYLETVLAREDHAKEVKLFGLGPLLPRPLHARSSTLYAEDRELTLRRGSWGFVLGAGRHRRVLRRVRVDRASRRSRGAITLGEMTMYLLVFKQGQGALTASLGAIGGMYEDNLYLSNLYEFLDTPVRGRGGTATAGPNPGDGVASRTSSFTLPGRDERRRSPTSTCTSRPAASSRSSARTARARPR